MDNLTKAQQNAMTEMYYFSIERPRIISKKINDILNRDCLKHLPLAYRISNDEAKQLFPEMEIYRDYGNAEQGLVLSFEEIENETEMDYCVEHDSLTQWLPF
ncbi:hypothetical protein [Sulfurimonas sp.]|uniref:hypothetical protein n=1 Tax=Sulfurimonas sp. TaxID=2022749 RepID=UPI0025D7486D|nr:hypothetical protein [Sulfurimonas sp.]